MQRPVNKRLSHARDYEIQLLLHGADPFKQTRLAKSDPKSLDLPLLGSGRRDARLKETSVLGRKIAPCVCALYRDAR